MSQPQRIIVTQRGGCLDAVIFLLLLGAITVGGCSYCGYRMGRNAIEQAEKITAEDAERKAKEAEGVAE